MFRIVAGAEWTGGQIMECCGPGYASPAEAIRAPREKLLYTIAI